MMVKNVSTDTLGLSGKHSNTRVLLCLYSNTMPVISLDSLLVYLGLKGRRVSLLVLEVLEFLILPLSTAHH